MIKICTQTFYVEGKYCPDIDKKYRRFGTKADLVNVHSFYSDVVSISVDSKLLLLGFTAHQHYRLYSTEDALETIN